MGQTTILRSISSLLVLDRYLTLSLFNINLGPVLSLFILLEQLPGPSGLCLPD